MLTTGLCQRFPSPSPFPLRQQGTLIDPHGDKMSTFYTTFNLHNVISQLCLTKKKKKRSWDLLKEFYTFYTSFIVFFRYDYYWPFICTLFTSSFSKPDVYWHNFLTCLPHSDLPILHLPSETSQLWFGEGDLCSDYWFS